jgi:simple sugar transport system ATP-binding protein
MQIEEMLRTCSHIAVLRDGKMVGELTGEELTQAYIMQTIAGNQPGKVAAETADEKGGANV